MGCHMLMKQSTKETSHSSYSLESALVVQYVCPSTVLKCSRAYARTRVCALAEVDACAFLAFFSRYTSPVIAGLG